ncbi:hypothetical protein [Consotaella aegiceratis]|uniref:hypothetical protein n=1 Tax=Consotaella aegiceratis TaxID=3097961 RepID=UPI002F429EA2
MVEGDGNARVVLWPGNGGRFRSFQVITMKDGAATVELQHATDCVYYAVSGNGDVVDLTTGERQALVEGAMVHIDAGDRYRIDAGDAGIEVLGGPCPPDEAFYAAFGVEVESA